MFIHLKQFTRKVIKEVKSNPIYIYIFFYGAFLILLTFFRDATADETYYLKETLLMSELLKEGFWVGDYGVGLHGFLFKLPVALLYTFLAEPCVLWATLYTIAFNLASLLLFYKIARRFFKKDLYIFWSTVLFSVMFHFIIMSLTFNRDIVAVFTVLFFIFLFLKKVNTWWVGLSLLLMLDAKEHIFITIAPAFGLYVLINNLLFVNEKIATNFFKRVKDILLELFRGYLFSIIWIILMFFTSVIPVNMFIASVGGLIDSGLEWNVGQFRSSYATENVMSGQKKEIPSFSKKFISKEDSAVCFDNTNPEDRCTRTPIIVSKIFSSIDFVLGYLGKILYPRTFSFISVPKIIVLPSFITAIVLMKVWFMKKDRKIILPIILFLNFLVLILRASHGRYLLGITPLFSLFFIIFIKKGLEKPKLFKKTLVATTIFVLAGLGFESTFLAFKIVLEMFILVMLWLIWFFRDNPKLLYYAKRCFLLALLTGMFLTSLAHSYSIGQISSYTKYGYNRQTKEIVSYVSPGNKVWINDYGSGKLVDFYLGSSYVDPEWVWRLNENIPKKSELKIYEEKKVYSMEIRGMDEFKKQLEFYKISEVLLVTSVVPDEAFSEQHRLNELLSQDWLRLVEKIHLQNKILYVFNFSLVENGRN